MSKVRAWCRRCGAGGVMQTGWTKVSPEDGEYLEGRGVRVLHPSESGGESILARLRLRHLGCPACKTLGSLTQGRGPNPVPALPLTPDNARRLVREHYKKNPPSDPA